MRLSDKQRKLLILAFDPSASIKETMAALRAVFRDWIRTYPDGYTLVRDLEGEKTIYREKGNPYGEFVLSFGRHKGKPLKEIPVSYLIWCLDNFEDLWPQTRKAIERYLGED